MDTNNNQIPDRLETVAFLIKMGTPILLLFVGVIISIYGLLIDNDKIVDYGTLLSFGGGTATGLHGDKRK